MTTLSQSTIKRTVCGLSLASLAFLLSIERPSGQDQVFGTWTELGPQLFYGINPKDGISDELMSGQPSSIAVDLVSDSSGNTVHVATAGGGLWKSTNGLNPDAQFELLSDPDLTLSCGAVALDSSTNPPTIYVGTGDPDNPSDVSSYSGTGILVSRDGGQTWAHVQSADGGAHPFKGMGFSRIIVDPDNPAVVLASTGVGSDFNFAHSAYPQGNTAFDHLGIYRSGDAGHTWSRVRGTSIQGNNIGEYFHIDLVHEAGRDLYMAGISKQGLFASADGILWRSIGELGIPTAGLPAVQDMHRISLASREGTLWALIMVIPSLGPAEVFTAQKLLELSPNASSWRAIPLPSTFGHKGFLGYVAAPPGSTGLVVATQFLYRTDDISGTDPDWKQIEFYESTSLHGDQHAIAFASADNWYVGDDGGMFATLNRGDARMSLNASLRTTEFYSASPDAADSGSYVGGQQDNGPALSVDGVGWLQLQLGDGMYTHADPLDANGFFVSTQFGDIRYLPTDPADIPKIVIDFFDDASPATAPGGRGAFLTPYELLPADPRLYEGVTAPPGFDFSQARILLTGNKDPWLAAFIPGADPVITRLTSAIDKSFIQYVAPDPQDATSASVITGHGDPRTTYQSSLYRLANIGFAGNATVTTLRKPEELPWSPDHDVLGHAVVSQVCSESLYVAKVGFLEGRKIFKTTTGGERWTNISGNLPNVPVHWITLDPVNPDVIYVGTNVGAFVTTDGGVEGSTWQRLGTGLPNVPVMQLKVSPTRKLVAATFGRGVWTLDLPALSPWIPKSPVIADVSVSQPILTPPDHRIVDVTVNYTATDDCGTPACTLSVVSSEPGDGLGDGDTPVDFEILDSHRLRLRAERSGLGQGRTYTITITCTGSDGLATSTSTTVFVPRDRE